MELRHLRYFLTVAEERQFTRAAARLHIQQPPLSQQIQELERELGFALFTRLPRGVELTSAGAAFEVDARAVLDALDQGVVNARRVANGQLGSVRIALTSSAAFHPLATAAIRRFRATHPDIAIDLNEINAADIIERMMNGRVDAGILRKPIEMPAELRFDLLHEERMVLVLPVGHKLLPAKGVRPGKQPRVPLKARAGIHAAIPAGNRGVLRCCRRRSVLRAAPSCDAARCCESGGTPIRTSGVGFRFAKREGRRSGRYLSTPHLTIHLQTQVRVFPQNRWNKPASRRVWIVSSANHRA